VRFFKPIAMILFVLFLIPGSFCLGKKLCLSFVRKLFMAQVFPLRITPVSCKACREMMQTTEGDTGLS